MDEVPPGEKIFAKTLTAERLDRLNSIEFVWVVTGPNASWEDRFKDLMEYYEMHGKWPSQSMGTLGLWVNKQRAKYSRKDPNFMKTRALTVRESGGQFIVCVFLLETHPFFSSHVFPWTVG